MGFAPTRSLHPDGHRHRSPVRGANSAVVDVWIAVGLTRARVWNREAACLDGVEEGREDGSSVGGRVPREGVEVEEDLIQEPRRFRSGDVLRLLAHGSTLPFRLRTLHRSDAEEDDRHLVPDREEGSTARDLDGNGREVLGRGDRLAEGVGELHGLSIPSPAETLHSIFEDCEEDEHERDRDG